MITLTKFKSAVMDGFRSIKVLGWGKSALTADECAPFGDDGNPLKDMVAVYAETEESGDAVIIGYLNKNQLAAPGEKRIFSLRSDGTLSFYAWLKNNGTMELGGTGNNLVRYTALNNALQDEKSLINAELSKIQIAIAALGGSYVTTPITVNISSSKINEIKCI